MKRNTTRLFSGLTIVICLIFAFALTVAAQTGLSEDQIMIGETVNVSLDVPSGARVSAWSCTPYGALSFSATTNTGTTYKTVATAVKPGEITVRATVKYADNTTSTVTVGTLLTVLEDGIYTVGNEYADDYYSQSGAFYLRSQITYPTSGGLFVAQHSQNNFGDITNKIYNYWYIEHQGSGQYTIRSVADENKALTYSGSTFSLSTIGSNVTTAAKWYIRGENIIPVSATTKCLILSSAAPEGTYHTDGNAYTYFNLHVNGIGGIAIENWSFEKENISGVIFKKNNSEEFKTTFTKSYHINTDTVNFSELGYSIKTYHYANCPTPTFEWFSSNSSVATINKTTGKLTLKNVGVTTITLRAWFSPNTYYEDASYEIAVILKENTYFLNNSKTNLYAGIQNATLSDGNEIEQQLFDGENKQKWVLEHVESNIYTIKASNSSSYYLGVKNDSASSGAEVVLRTGNITDGMKWRIEKGKSGYKLISCLSTPNNNPFVLCTYSTSSTNGEKLIIGGYTSDTNYNDEWKVCEFDRAILLAIDHGDGYNRYDYFSGTKVNLQTERNEMVSIVNTVRFSDMTKSNIIDYMRNNEIFIIHTHGSKQSLVIKRDNSRVLTMNDLTGVDLSNLKFVLLLTCRGGLDYNKSNIINGTPQNIVEKLVVCGAETVVGFAEDIYTTDCNRFAVSLTDKIINQNMTVQDAIDNINYSFYRANMSNFDVVAGNPNNKLR